MLVAAAVAVKAVSRGAMEDPEVVAAEGKAQMEPLELPILAVAAAEQGL